MTPCALELAVGQAHACVLTDSGAVECWGGNSDGECGVGTGENSVPTPTRVELGGEAHHVTAGWFDSCAETGAGTFQCWGETGLVNLANGTAPSTNHASPAKVGPFGVKSMAPGRGHLCAVQSSGKAACLGLNASGQLGRGFADTDVKATFETIEGLDSTAWVAAGPGTTCGGLRDGTVLCWGMNDENQAGPTTGSLSTSDGRPAVLRPRVLPELVGGTSAGLGFKHGCMLLSSGNVTCWGANDQGQAGAGPGSNLAWPPHEVSGLKDIVDLAVGSSLDCALTRSGDVWCWGSNEYGGLGQGAEDTIGHPEPVRVDVTDAVQVGAGEGHACALLRTGRVECWGSNALGQMGSGSTDALTHRPKAVFP